MIYDEDNDMVYFGKILACSDNGNTVLDTSFNQFDESIYSFSNENLPFLKSIDLFFVVIYE